MTGLRAVVLGLLVSWAPLAAAEPDPPWAAGVSTEDQARATEAFDRGNALSDQSQFAAALEIYREAIKIWDHPRIRYNMAVALINLDRQIDAYRELERALTVPEALEPEIRQQAITDEHLLRAHIVVATIECVVPETRISIDGTELAIPCPGTSTQLVLPGAHRLVATKPGYLTRTLVLTPAGGDAPHERIRLKSIDEATVLRRRWSPWLPWTVAGAGSLAGLVGLGFELQSAATFRSYDRAVAALCPDHPCSALPGVVTDAYADARRDNHIALGLFAASGATLATGAVLLWLNRAVSERIGYDDVPIVSANVGVDHWSVAASLAF